MDKSHLLNSKCWLLAIQTAQHQSGTFLGFFPLLIDLAVKAIEFIHTKVV